MAQDSATLPTHVACIAELPLGREMAHAINAFKTAGGFARLGCRVTVFCLPPVGGDIPAALAVYGEPNLQVQVIEPRTGVSEDEASRGFSQAAVDEARKAGCEFVYARNFYAGLFGPRAGLTTVIETHAHVGDDRPLLDDVFAATRDPAAPLHGIVTIAPALRDHYIARGADPQRVHIVFDGADPDLFRRPRDLPQDPAAELGLDPARPRALYSGHLYDYKGIPTILDAARLAPEIDWLLLGGTRADVASVRERAANLANVHVLGRVPHALVPAHLWHADVLLLPPSANHPSAGWTSPVKLAEYLCAARPIVATRIQGLINWVDEPAVIWCNPDEAASLAGSVQRALGEGASARLLREEAQLRLAETFTYANRARMILDAGRVLTP